MRYRECGLVFTNRFFKFAHWNTNTCRAFFFCSWQLRGNFRGNRRRWWKKKHFIVFISLNLNLRKTILWKWRSSIFKIEQVRQIDLDSKNCKLTQESEGYIATQPIHIALRLKLMKNDSVGLPHAGMVYDCFRATYNKNNQGKLFGRIVHVSYC